MFAKYTVGGRLDPPFHPTKTKPYFEGRQLSIPTTANVNRDIKDTFYLSHDVEFFALSFRSDSGDFRDNWSLTVGGETIVKELHCLQYGEGLYFQVAHPVPAGQEFKLEYRTSDGKTRSVEVLYHFLTDPDVDPVLVGTTDLGNYPEPPPEPVDDDTPVEVPGGVQLPLKWAAFTEVRAAEAWAKSIGVDGSFGTNLAGANYVTEALAFLFNTCGGFADMVAKHPLKISIKDGNGANGYFNPPTQEVVVSKSYDFSKAADIAQMEYETRQKSSPNRLRTVIHEIGHWLHFNNVGAELFYKYSSLDPDNYGNKTILTQSEANYVATHLCQYATKWFPIELMPETFVAKITGVPVDPKIWEWYEQYGGFTCSNW